MYLKLLKSPRSTTSISSKYTTHVSRRIWRVSKTPIRFTNYSKMLNHGYCTSNPKDSAWEVNESYEHELDDEEEIPILEFNWPVFEQEIKENLQSKINASYVRIIDKTPPGGMNMVLRNV